MSLDIEQVLRKIKPPKYVFPETFREYVEKVASRCESQDALEAEVRWTIQDMEYGADWP